MIKQTAFADIADYMDLLLDAICVVDKSNTFRYVSPGAKRVFGYSPHEMVGRSMFDFVHPDDKNTTGQVAEKVNTGDEVLHFENRYRAYFMVRALVRSRSNAGGGRSRCNQTKTAGSRA